ncbi:unnamed protein product [Oncorhynchus mykiss]|uniref:Ubiquinol-cytochrome c reductase complex chaperone CBP3 homolog n=1 Tax=Oncorhynchus mykiss TaxID=8022 RepID=A0A060WT40_ONCMY|nr:unnamed protein product [Oncorhynchus mykiss]
MRQGSFLLFLHSQLFNVKETPQTAMEEEVGAFTKLIEAMGFTGPLKYNKWKIKIAALRMYTCCVERINYDEFFEKCSLPDTLNSWFLVAQLHVWRVPLLHPLYRPSSGQVYLAFATLC